MIKYLSVIVLVAGMTLLSACDRGNHPAVPTTPPVTPSSQIPPPSNPTVPNTPGGTTTATNAPHPANQ